MSTFAGYLHMSIFDALWRFDTTFGMSRNWQRQRLLSGDSFNSFTTSQWLLDLEFGARYDRGYTRIEPFINGRILNLTEPRKAEKYLTTKSYTTVNKYYNGKLEIRSKDNNPHPLTFVDIPEAESSVKNTAPEEAEQVAEYVRQNRDKQIGIITPFANQKALIEETLRGEGINDIQCGTVHAFQGDEKDVILFSLGLSDTTKQATYEWLKNNRELINVATSRARDELVVFGSDKNLSRLHDESDDDDLFELVTYIKENGESKVTQRTAASRALGIKPYSTETEAAFMETLNHAIDVLQPSGQRYTVHKEVPVSQVFADNISYEGLFYTGRFDFVVYERRAKRELPVLALELDGKEHFTDEVVKERDRQKNQICRDHNFELIRVENTYSRRYHYIKDILINYFAS